MPTPIPIIFQFLSILPELNRRHRFGRPGSYPLDQGCIYISTAIPSTAIQTAYTKNSYTDIVLRAAAFCARIRRRQMRHILAFSQVTFAETCCLAGNCIGLVYPYAEPISPRSGYRRIPQDSYWIFLTKVLCIFFAFQQELTIGIEPITSSLQVMRTANCAMPAK